MTLQDKIAAFLYESENEHSWEDWEGLSYDQQYDWKEKADSIVDLMAEHFRIR